MSYSLYKWAFKFYTNSWSQCLSQFYSHRFVIYFQFSPLKEKKSFTEVVSLHIRFSTCINKWFFTSYFNVFSTVFTWIWNFFFSFFLFVFVSFSCSFYSHCQFFVVFNHCCSESFSYFIWMRLTIVAHVNHWSYWDWVSQHFPKQVAKKRSNKSMK